MIAVLLRRVAVRINRVRSCVDPGTQRSVRVCYYYCCRCCDCCLLFLILRRRGRRPIWRCGLPLLEHQSFRNTSQFSPVARSSFHASSVGLDLHSGKHQCAPSPSNDNNVPSLVLPPVHRPRALLPSGLFPGPPLSSLFLEEIVLERETPFPAPSLDPSP